MESWVLTISYLPLLLTRGIILPKWEDLEVWALVKNERIWVLEGWGVFPKRDDIGIINVDNLFVGTSMIFIFIFWGLSKFTYFSFRNWYLRRRFCSLHFVHIFRFIAFPPISLSHMFHMTHEGFRSLVTILTPFQQVRLFCLVTPLMHLHFWVLSLHRMLIFYLFIIFLSLFGWVFFIIIKVWKGLFIKKLSYGFEVQWSKVGRVVFLWLLSNGLSMKGPLTKQDLQSQLTTTLCGISPLSLSGDFEYFR